MIPSSSLAKPYLGGKKKKKARFSLYGIYFILLPKSAAVSSCLCCLQQ